MEAFEYTVNEEIITIEGKIITVYGISVLSQCDAAAAKEIIRIPNISTDKSSLVDFATLCNSMNLSPIHIEEAISDFLIYHN
ncbi:MAG: hypothetical protein IJW19_06085 [Clostridia bacterium]|nr:hypothetical protein [Clostridia bacterium]